MRPVEFETFAEDVKLVLRDVLIKFNLKVKAADTNSFYCVNDISGIHIYYEGSTLQFILIDSLENKYHIYELLNKKGLSFLIPIKVCQECLEQLNLKFPEFKYQFYLEDICWIASVGKILIQYFQEEFLGK